MIGAKIKRFSASQPKFRVADRVFDLYALTSCSPPLSLYTQTAGGYYNMLLMAP